MSPVAVSRVSPGGKVPFTRLKLVGAPPEAVTLKVKLLPTRPFATWVLVIDTTAGDWPQTPRPRRSAIATTAKQRRVASISCLLVIIPPHIRYQIIDGSSILNALPVMFADRHFSSRNSTQSAKFATFT